MKKKTAIIIGYGGMGKRYVLALQKMKFKIVGICDLQKNIIINKKIFFTNNYQNLIKFDADLLCLTSNTVSRYKIIREFIIKSKIKNIITEKPLATNYQESLSILKLAKLYKKKITINSYRPLLKNFYQIKNFTKKINEEIKNFTIMSPSAGLGNMGSVFFDLGIFFLEQKPKSVYCKIDDKNTPSPRGKQFKDPGGYGIINFDKKKRLIFDLSEDTGLPYKIIIKSKNYEFNIDELNNSFKYCFRPTAYIKKPLYYYLFKPITKYFKVYKKYDPVEFTICSIQNLFSKKFNFDTLKRSIQVIELIIACHISSKLSKEIKLPLNKKYFKFSVPFA
jgi:predicted dehydrogenase